MTRARVPLAGTTSARRIVVSDSRRTHYHGHRSRPCASTRRGSRPSTRRAMRRCAPPPPSPRPSPPLSPRALTSPPPSTPSRLPRRRRCAESCRTPSRAATEAGPPRLARASLATSDSAKTPTRPSTRSSPPPSPSSGYARAPTKPRSAQISGPSTIMSRSSSSGVPRPSPHARTLTPYPTHPAHSPQQATLRGDDETFAAFAAVAPLAASARRRRRRDGATTPLAATRTRRAATRRRRLVRPRETLGGERCWREARHSDTFTHGRVGGDAREADGRSPPDGTRRRGVGRVRTRRRRRVARRRSGNSSPPPPGDCEGRNVGVAGATVGVGVGGRVRRVRGWRRRGRSSSSRGARR